MFKCTRSLTSGTSLSYYFKEVYQCRMTFHENVLLVVANMSVNSITATDGATVNATDIGNMSYLHDSK